MENLLFQYIENHKLNIDQNIIVDEFFDLKKNNSIYFKDITKNLDFAAENFLLKVFRENPYRIIKEKLGDEALLWFYLKEIETMILTKNLSNAIYQLKKLMMIILKIIKIL